MVEIWRASAGHCCCSQSSVEQLCEERATQLAQRVAHSLADNIEEKVPSVLVRGGQN